MRQQLVNSVYNMVESLSQSDFNKGVHSFRNSIPSHFNVAGLYIVLDPHSTVEIGNLQRIVRVGLTKGENSRLAFHQNGNIENSIFRKHIQRALDDVKNDAHDIRVSDYIQSLNYVFLPVDDYDLLHHFEKTLIAILSNTNQPSVFPSQQEWLGFNNGDNANPAVASSHLWNVHHTKAYKSEYLQHYQNVLLQLNGLIEAIN